MASKKLTQAQIKKSLSQMEKPELIDIICRLCKSSEEAKDQMNLILGNDSFVDDALEETKRKVRNQFFPTRGFGKLNLSKAKSDISAFKKICKDPKKILDLQLYYAECGIEFTNDYGDINESFYNSIGRMYEKVVQELIKTGNKDLIGEFEPRLKKAVDDTCYIGWGFGDWISDSYSEIRNYLAEG